MKYLVLFNSKVSLIYTRKAASSSPSHSKDIRGSYGGWCQPPIPIGKMWVHEMPWELKG